MSDQKPAVLILCSQNSCRSQMAEALLRTRAADRFDVYSAGLEAAPQIFPPARQAIEELGLDMSGQHVKTVDEFLGKLPVRYMIVVCDAATVGITAPARANTGMRVNGASTSISRPPVIVAPV